MKKYKSHDTFCFVIRTFSSNWLHLVLLLTGVPQFEPCCIHACFSRFWNEIFYLMFSSHLRIETVELFFVSVSKVPQLADGQVQIKEKQCHGMAFQK